MISTHTAHRSTNIERVDYNSALQQIIIHFKSGGSYQYANVDPFIHQGFINSKSLGKAFNSTFYANPNRFPPKKLAPTNTVPKK